MLAASTSCTRNCALHSGQRTSSRGWAIAGIMMSPWHEAQDEMRDMHCSGTNHTTPQFISGMRYPLYRPGGVALEKAESFAAALFLGSNFFAE